MEWQLLSRDHWVYFRRKHQKIYRSTTERGWLLMMMTMTAYQFKLAPTPEQREQIYHTLNLCRWLYNSGLEQRMIAYEKQGKCLSFYTQKKELPALKKVLPEFKGIHSQVLQNVPERLDGAYQNFFRRVKTGEKAGFPRFKGRNHYHSFTYPQSGFKIEGNFLTLSKIGKIQINRHRVMKGQVKTCQIIHKNGQFLVSFSCEINARKLKKKNQRAVGIDLGVRHLAITSDGNFHDNPKHLQQLEHKLKKKQRLVSKKKRGSNRRKKAVHQLAKLHEHIANKRKDTAHQTARNLVDAYDLLVFEDLDIQKMVKSHDYAKSIVDSAWRKLIDYTTYKAAKAGKQVLLVNPYNTTQQCSNCLEIVRKTKGERVHRCRCGYVDDRDVNAAKNILRLVLEQIA
nr:transposase [Sporosarcina sp. E16_8]